MTGVAAPISPGAAALTMNVVEPSGGTAARNATSTVEPPAALVTGSSSCAGTAFPSLSLTIKPFVRVEEWT